jgi:hypothetical protein
MNEGIGLLDLIIAGGLPSGGLVAQFVHMKMNQATMQTEISNLKDRLAEEVIDNKLEVVKIWDKLDTIYDLLTEIKIDLAK